MRTEIEITPAMVEAGVSALANYDSMMELEDSAVKRIYSAMEEARRNAIEDT